MVYSNDRYGRSVNDYIKMVESREEYSDGNNLDAREERKWGEIVDRLLEELESRKINGIDDNQRSNKDSETSY